MSSVLGVIPARGGSKGVPRKNLALIGGRPLISWSIETGKELVSSGALSRCVVSTDDAEIAEVARGLGADVPFIRPPEIAGDSSKASEYLRHALDFLDPTGRIYSYALILQPTSPQRDAMRIGHAISQFCQSGFESMISCYEDAYVNPAVMYELLDDTVTLRGLTDLHGAELRRQDHRPVLIRTGVLYLVSVDYFRSTGRIISGSPALYRVSRREAVNVDTPEDLELLKALL